MKVKVFIDGGEGTTGLRLAERLSARDDIELLQIDGALRKDAGERAKISGSADIVFLCLPDAAAKEAVANIKNPATKVIDASTAHRTAEDWAYGLPELSAAHREKVAASKRVSVPGCHAMGFGVLAYPLVANKIAPADYPFTCHSVTGYSGGGKSLIATYQSPERDVSYRAPRQYALSQVHKHLPEMQKVSGLSYPPVFNPILADIYAGMVVTIPLHLRLLDVDSAEALHAMYARHYAGQQLVKVMPFGDGSTLSDGALDAGALAGLDTAQIFVWGNSERAIVAARFDNLGKGASGAAIQCMNILCGLPETTGLCLEVEETECR